MEEKSLRITGTDKGVENIEGYIYTDLGDKEDYFALRVKDDSMNKAYIKEGSILIARKQSIVSNGDIAVVIVGGDDAVISDGVYHPYCFAG